MKAQQKHKGGVHVVCVGEAQCGTTERGSDDIEVLEKHHLATHTSHTMKAVMVVWTEASSVGHTSTVVHCMVMWHVFPCTHTHTPKSGGVAMGKATVVVAVCVWTM